MSQSVMCPACRRPTRVADAELTADEGFCAACGAGFALVSAGDGAHRSALVAASLPPSPPSRRVERLTDELVVRVTQRPLVGRVLPMVGVLLGQTVGSSRHLDGWLIGLQILLALIVALSLTPAWNRRVRRPQRLVRRGDELQLLGWRRRSLPPIVRTGAVEQDGCWHLVLHGEKRSFAFGQHARLGAREVAWLRAEVEDLLQLAPPAANRRLLTHAGPRAVPADR